jgi:hypothetical protein
VIVEPFSVVGVLVLLAFIAAAGFPIVYAFYPWWRTAAGRSVMGLALVIAFTLGLSLWRVWFGPPPDFVRIPVYALVVVALWAQLIVLLLAPRLNRRRLARLPVPPISEVPREHI